MEVLKGVEGAARRRHRASNAASDQSHQANVIQRGELACIGASPTASVVSRKWWPCCFSPNPEAITRPEAPQRAAIVAPAACSSRVEWQAGNASFLWRLS